jgi:hypothetical protein
MSSASSWALERRDEVDNSDLLECLIASVARRPIAPSSFCP